MALKPTSYYAHTETPPDPPSQLISEGTATISIHGTDVDANNKNWRGFIEINARGDNPTEVRDRLVNELRAMASKLAISDIPE